MPEARPYVFRTFMRFETGAAELAFSTAMAVANAERQARRVDLRCYRVP